MTGPEGSGSRFVGFLRRDHPEVPPLHKVIAKAVANAVVLTGGIAGVAVVAPKLLDQFVVHDMVFPERKTPVVDPVLERASALLEEHGCWTAKDEDPPDDAVPGGVVVMMPGEQVPVHGRGDVVAAALEHAFGERTEGMVVYGFCP